MTTQDSWQLKREKTQISEKYLVDIYFKICIVAKMPPTVRPSSIKSGAEPYGDHIDLVYQVDDGWLKSSQEVVKEKERKLFETTHSEHMISICYPDTSDEIIYYLQFNETPIYDNFMHICPPTLFHGSLI